MISKPRKQLLMEMSKMLLSHIAIGATCVEPLARTLLWSCREERALAAGLLDRKK
jgi:hypothetical protein